MSQLTLARLTWIHFRVGNVTFGGGDPTMAALHSELVVREGWLSSQKYGLIYALARVTPGTNMLAFCAGVAWELLGWPAAILAVAAVTVPSAALILLLTQGYESLQSNALAMAAIGAVLAATVGMMLAGAWQLIRPQLIRPHLDRRRWLRAVVVAPAAVALSLGFGLSPIQVLGLAAAVGLVWRAR